jgi:hypothetical protein
MQSEKRGVTHTKERHMLKVGDYIRWDKVGRCRVWIAGRWFSVEYG